MTEPTPQTDGQQLPLVGEIQDQPAAQLRAVPDQPADTVTADPDDGRIKITLHTENGDGDFWVPPMTKWRAQARSALMTRGDSLFWAAKTLTEDEAIRWADLDPNQDETEPFFAEFMRRSGLTNRAQRRGNRIA